MDISILEALGLTRNEAIAYLSLIKIGTSKTGNLLKVSGLNTGKIYEILESLKRKGLVSETEINKIKHFTASPPKKLNDYLLEKKRRIEAQEELAKSAIVQIEKLREVKLEPSRVEVYTGFEGFKTAVWEATKTLKPQEEVLAMGVRSSKGELFNKVWREWADKTLPNNHERVIFSEKGYFFEYKKKSRFSRIKYLESTTPTAITIFGKHTALILQYHDPVKVIFINDDLIVGTFVAFFEHLWKSGKEP